MIRFRHAEDEKRYNLIRADIYMRVVENLPPALVSEILQSLSKIETMLHLEGLRQGLAVALLTQASEAPRMKAFQQHAVVYGSADTPLIHAEAPVAAQYLVDPAHPWLDPEPMRFAPKPFGRNPPPMIRVDAPPQAAPPPVRQPDVPEPDDLDDVARQLDMPRAMLDELIARRAAGGPADPIAIPSTALLDRVREHIKAKQGGGWKPDTYEEVVLTLHLEMQIDAVALDLNLSTHEGRTVLDQCGLFGVKPPPEGDARMLSPDEALKFMKRGAM